MNKNLTFLILILATNSFFWSQKNQVQKKKNSNLDKLYSDYCRTNKKSYKNQNEYNFRKRIFENNLSKLITSFDNLKNEYKIIEEITNDEKIERIILANPKNDCDCELALNKFTDLTDFEFRQTHLLPSEFFDSKNFVAKNQIFDPTEFYPGTSFHGHTNWISDNLNKLLNDNNFDIFKTTLLNRQKPKKKKNNYFNHNYNSHFIHDTFLNFTKHNVVKHNDDMYDFLFDTMPSYDQIYNDDFIDEDDLKCSATKKNKHHLVGEGRHLQEWYTGNNYSSNNDWFNDFSNTSSNTSSNNNWGTNDSNWITNDSSTNWGNDNATTNWGNDNATTNWGNDNATTNWGNDNSTSSSWNNDNWGSNTNNVSTNSDNSWGSSTNWNGDLFSNDNYSNASSNNKKNTSNNNWSTSNDWDNWGNDTNWSSSNNSNSSWTNYTPQKKKSNQRQTQRKRQTQRQTQRKRQTQSSYTDPFSVYQTKPKQQRTIRKTSQSHIKLDGVKIPTYLNWQDKRSFTPVKDQKNCNACYAFGAISAIEAHNILKHNDYSTYSEQEILDCSEFNKACVGGQPFMVYDYVKKNGLHKDNSYPYLAKKRRCRKNNLTTRKFKKLKGYIFTKTGIKNLLIAANFGPIVVVSFASDHLKYYYKGVFRGQGCSGNETPNHASLLYGYNLKVDRPYLLFKNNWGTGWGNSGYYKVEIGDLEDSNNGHCLIANTPYNTMPLL